MPKKQASLVGIIREAKGDIAIRAMGLGSQNFGTGDAFSISVWDHFGRQ